MDAARNGNFTSSCISALMSNGRKAGEPGKPFLTYISEKNMERKLGRALDSETNAKPMNWGKLCEKRVFDLLYKIDVGYIECGTETIKHPRYDFWLGSPDAKRPETTVEVKCPFTLKSFCQFIDAIEGFPGIDAINSIRNNHPDGEDYYWQILSNSILLNSKYAELIIYMPYRNELDEIRVLASNMPVADLSKYYGLANSTDEELPYLIEGKGYKNLNIIRFEVPESDKILLTERVLLASKSLITV
jgi:hypothetical protein